MTTARLKRIVDAFRPAKEPVNQEESNVFGAECQQQPDRQGLHEESETKSTSLPSGDAEQGSGVGKETAKIDSEKIRSVASKGNDSPAIDITPLIAVFQSIQDSLNEIRAQLTEKLETNQTILHQSETLRHMSDRVRALEDDLVQEHVLKPILREVILLHDELTKARGAVGQGKMTQEGIADLLNGLQSQVLDFLACHGVTQIKDTTNILNPKLQKVVGVRRINIAEDGEVIEVVRPGFRQGETVMRHEEVVVQTNK